MAHWEESSDVEKAKKLLRQQMSQMRGELSRQEQSRRSAQAAQHLLELQPLTNSRTILAFYPFRDEIDTRPFLEAAGRRGQEVWLPLTDPACRRIHPHVYRGRDSLRRGAYGILEPDPEQAPPADPERLDAVVVPGLAFDRSGGRLGYGGGYYDRFLADLSHRPLLVGLAYSIQLVESVPRERHDIPLHYLVTEDGVLGPFGK